LSDDIILGVGTSYKLYYRQNMEQPWAKSSDVGGQLKGVAITADGKISGVRINDKLYIRETLYS